MYDTGDLFEMANEDHQRFIKLLAEIESYGKKTAEELGFPAFFFSIEKKSPKSGINYPIYSLDAIIAVGYRVNSARATQFRIWATKVLKEYIIKGFALNDERMKTGRNRTYFDELQERKYTGKIIIDRATQSSTIRPASKQALR